MEQVQIEKESKQHNIIKELLRRAKQIKFGTMIVEFKINGGNICAGEIVEQKIKLG